MKKIDKILLLTLLFVVIIIGVIWYYWDKVETDDGGGDGQSVVVTNFEQCLAAGYGVTEMFPRQCQTPDGRTFVEDIGNALEKADLIQVDSPRPNSSVISPLRITGKARGKWFFEASFPIKVYDADGKELGTAIAQAQSEWMTEEFVPFEAFLEFSDPTTPKGTIVLNRDNPSDLPENDDNLTIPILFGSKENMQTVYLYYYNPENDKDASGNVKCSKDGLVAVERSVPSGSTAIEDTIKLLLEGGLTQKEKAAGITTEYPLSGFELKTAYMNNGVLTLTFDDPDNKTVGGACRVGVLWSQIEATAKQFPEVTGVKFSPDTLFQP